MPNQEINPFEADVSPVLTANQGVQSSQNGAQLSTVNPFEQDVAPYKGAEDGSFNSGLTGSPAGGVASAGHNIGLVAGDIPRALVAAPASIIDLGARIPTWAVRTATGDTQDYPYPPSLNDIAQNQLTKLGLPTPQDNFEGYVDAGMRNAAFGPAGAIVGVGGRALQQYYPEGNQNITVGGRDVGLSPNDLGTAGIGAVASGASPARASAIDSAVGTDAARVASTAMDHGVKVYPTDIAQGGLGKTLLDFYNATPLSGKEGRMAGQQTDLNTAATGAMGQPSPELTAPLMDKAATDTGAIYDDLASRYDVPIGKNDRTALSQLQQNATRTLVGDDETAFNKQYQNVVDAVHNATSGSPSGGSGIITGQQYQALRSQIGKAAVGKNGSPEMFQLQNFLDSRMQAQMTPVDAASFTQANKQWRSMLALEPAAAKALRNGNVDPNALLSGSKKIYPNTIYNDKNTIPQAAQVGQMLDNSWKDQGSYVYDALHNTPWEMGAMSLYGATPVGSVMNRTANAALTPAELANPWLSQFYKATPTIPAQAQQDQTQSKDSGPLHVWITRHRGAQ